MPEENIISISSVMDQAQVFASAWSLVGGPFDNGEALEHAEEAKEELRAMLHAPMGGHFNFELHLQRQRDFSERTFGPGSRASGVVDHIRKELREIEESPGDLSEWIDVAILALDGAWRTGASPQQIIEALVAKQAKNEARTWPDWRTVPVDQAIEHDRSSEKTLKAYQVGDNDIVAAYDEAGAIKVLCEYCGYPDNEYDLEDVDLVEDRYLDAREAFDTDEGVVVKVDKTLREEMAELTEPAYLCGWE